MPRSNIYLQYPAPCVHAHLCRVSKYSFFIVKHHHLLGICNLQLRVRLLTTAGDLVPVKRMDGLLSSSARRCTQVSRSVRVGLLMCVQFTHLHVHFQSDMPSNSARVHIKVNLRMCI